jgi:hypothetical protein
MFDILISNKTSGKIIRGIHVDFLYVDGEKLDTISVNFSKNFINSREQ